MKQIECRVITKVRGATSTLEQPSFLISLVLQIEPPTEWTRVRVSFMRA